MQYNQTRLSLPQCSIAWRVINFSTCSQFQMRTRANVYSLLSEVKTPAMLFRSKCTWKHFTLLSDPAVLRHLDHLLTVLSTVQFRTDILESATCCHTERILVPSTVETNIKMSDLPASALIILFWPLWGEGSCIPTGRTRPASARKYWCFIEWEKYAQHSNNLTNLALHVAVVWLFVASNIQSLYLCSHMTKSAQTKFLWVLLRIQVLFCQALKFSLTQASLIFLQNWVWHDHV